MPTDSEPQTTERNVLTVIVWATCVAFLCGLTVADPDLWGHTLYGMRSIDQGLLTEHHDPFSYTAAGSEWVNHEWLTEYQFGWLWSHFGNGGLVMWRNAWCLLAMSVALLAIRQQKATLAASLLLLIFMSEALADFMVFVRPQMVTFGLFAVHLLLLRRFYAEPRVRWLLPLPFLIVLWVNQHGGFLAGLGLQALTLVAVGSEALNDPSRRRALKVMGTVFGASCLATFVNPFGAGLHLMLWDHLITTQAVREWQPLWAAQQSPVYYVPFLLIAIALLRIRRWNVLDTLLMTVVCWQAISHIRHVALLCIASLIILPEYLSESLRQLFPHLAMKWSVPDRRRLRVALTASVVLFMAALQVRGSWSMWQRNIGPMSIAVESASDVPGMPIRAVSFIREQGLRGNMLTDYGWGQFVIWHLYPDVRVAFDGRYRTVYPKSVETPFMEFQSAHQHQPPESDMLDRFPTDFVLLPSNRGACRYMLARPDWRQIYDDGQAAIFVADCPRYQPLISRFANDPASGRFEPKWIAFPGINRPGPDNVSSPPASTHLALTSR